MFLRLKTSKPKSEIENSYSLYHTVNYILISFGQEPVLISCFPRYLKNNHNKTFWYAYFLMLIEYMTQDFLFILVKLA